MAPIYGVGFRGMRHGLNNGVTVLVTMPPNDKETGYFAEAYAETESVYEIENSLTYSSCVEPGALHCAGLMHEQYATLTNDVFNVSARRVSDA